MHLRANRKWVKVSCAQKTQLSQGREHIYICISIKLCSCVCMRPNLKSFTRLHHKWQNVGGIFLPVDAKENTKTLCRISEFSRIGPDFTPASVTSLTVGLSQLMCHLLPPSAPGECLKAVNSSKANLPNEKRVVPGSSV